MPTKYVSKQWVTEPKPVEALIRHTGYRLVGTIDDDNYVIQRRGEKRIIFHLLHISWGDKSAVEKYKLYRIDPFSVSGKQVLEATETTDLE